jgi:hypothetical protein
VSQDGGKTWKEVSAAIASGASIASGTYVQRIAASGASRGTAYVAFDSHRSGDFTPYIARTTDFGKTWKRITDGLPGDASVRSVYEYPGIPNVVFAGTEKHLYVSRDSGAHWSQITANLPTTIYIDMVVHPRTKDLVVATHGRGIWVLDDASSIAQWSPRIAASSTYLFAPPRATVMQYWDDVSNMAQGIYAAENPADGATFTYWLNKPAQKVQLIVRDPRGKVIRTVAAQTAAGVIDRSVWDLRHEPPPAAPRRGGGEGGEGGDEAAGGRAARPALPIPMHEIGTRGPYVSPGTYTVTLDVDGDTTSRKFEVRADPDLKVTLAQHKAREAFLLDVQSQQVKVEQLAADLRARRAGATASDSTRVAALERRLTAGREGVRGSLSSIARAYNGGGAQQGSLMPPSTQHKQALADAKSEIAAIEKELNALRK